MYMKPKGKSAITEKVIIWLDYVCVKYIIYICVYQYCCVFANGDNIIWITEYKLVMKTFGHILYNIHVYLQNMQPIVYILYLFIIIVHFLS